MTDTHPLAKLSPRQRQVVELRIDGLTHREIADQLGICQSASIQVLFRAACTLGADITPRGSGAWLLPVAREVGRFEALHGARKAS